jgi:hypothetical protein
MWGYNVLTGETYRMPQMAVRDKEGTMMKL